MDLLFTFIVIAVVLILGNWMVLRFARKVLSSMLQPYPVTPWLLIGTAATILLSLSRGTFHPGHGSLFIGFGSKDRTHRGWPLPWYGLAGVEVVLAPLTFLADL